MGAVTNAIIGISIIYYLTFGAANLIVYNNNAQPPCGGAVGTLTLETWEYGMGIAHTIACALIIIGTLIFVITDHLGNGIASPLAIVGVVALIYVTGYSFCLGIYMLTISDNCLIANKPMWILGLCDLVFGIAFVIVSIPMIWIGVARQ